MDGLLNYIPIESFNSPFITEARFLADWGNSIQ
jgi:hypothetical protein